MPHQAASICQKTLLHPETLLTDDGVLLGNLLSCFSQNNMTEEAYALYLAANEKRKTNPNWLLRLDMLLLLDMIRVLCSKKETVHLAVKMLNDFPDELMENGDFLLKQRLFGHVTKALIGFKELEAAKQLVLKQIANSQHPPLVIDLIITALVKAGEIRQVLEMVMLLESIGFDIFYIFKTLMFRFGRSNGMLQIRKILEEAKNKDYKLIAALLYHTFIVGYCELEKFDAALKLLTQMKDFGFSDTNLDEYHKLIHSVCLMAMEAKLEKEQWSLWIGKWYNSS